jgi:uncharacterized protein
MIVVSFIQAQELLKAVDEDQLSVKISADLGTAPVKVSVSHKFKEVVFPDGSKISFQELDDIALDRAVCYVLEKNKRPQKVQLFSADTNRFYKLVPSRDAPTIEISGIRMHRTKDVTPWQDTMDKISALAPLRGIVLDTCCCMGYTAISAARQPDVKQVFTFERDTNVLELSDYNPWSKELYTNRKIRLAIGDINAAIVRFNDNFFDAIIHDPPRVALSPELYSGIFYKELFRVLKKGGKLFHYTGSPGEKLGKDIPKGVMRRLKEAGFIDVQPRRDILGVTARKP